MFLQLARAYDQFIIPLENFRKEHIGGVKVKLLLNIKYTTIYHFRNTNTYINRIRVFKYITACALHRTQ